MLPESRPDTQFNMNARFTEAERAKMPTEPEPLNDKIMKALMKAAAGGGGKKKKGKKASGGGDDADEDAPKASVGDIVFMKKREEGAAARKRSSSAKKKKATKGKKGKAAAAAGAKLDFRNPANAAKIPLHSRVYNYSVREQLRSENKGGLRQEMCAGANDAAAAIPTKNLCLTEGASLKGKEGEGVISNVMGSTFSSRMGV